VLGGASPEAGKEDLPRDNPDFADDPLFLFGTDHQGMFGLEFLNEGIQGRSRAILLWRSNLS
jgi:hypothetical protein